ncbi:MAG TPA: catalase, partial [bacterium]|nr:catalase [bacterium]
TSGDDRKPDQRAIAVKLLQVPGKKIIPGMENAPTQDFLLIRDPALPFKNADEFVPFITLIAAPLGLLRILFKVGLWRTLAIIKTVKNAPKIPMISLATINYFSAAPIKFGAYAAHYALKPLAQDGPGAQPGQTPNYLGEELAGRLKSGTVVYDFGAQFFVDETRTPIEDVSVEWKEETAPFIPLARLTLTQQDPDSAPGRRLYEFIEKLSFDPWHAPEEFRPLGNIMRARRVAYKASVKERQALPEPDGTEKFE